MEQAEVTSLELTQNGNAQAYAPDTEYQKKLKSLSKACTQRVEVKLTFADSYPWSGQRCGYCCHLFLINLVA